MKAMNFILLICFLMMSSTCENNKKDDCHETITFINNSTNELYVHPSGSYPDTLALKNEFPNPALNPDLYKIKSNESNYKALGRRDCYELAFGSSIIPSDTLMIYVFDAKVLETTPWDTVVSNYMVLKRYDLSLQDLRNKNWTITYP